MKMVLIETDYIYNKNKEAVIRLFGKDILNNKDTILHRNDTILLCRRTDRRTNKFTKNSIH